MSSELADEGARFPLVLAGPSGGGKTSVRMALLARRDDVRFSVSATTRAPRPGERDGTDYRFITREGFEELIRQGELLEWAEVHGELYGTPRDNLAAARADGCHLLLDIDVQGARQVREAVPGAVTVFLLPPDLDRLLERLRRRGTESPDQVRRRMRTALNELRSVPEFDYVLVNDVLEETVARVEAILDAESCRSVRTGAAAVRRARALADELARRLQEPATDVEMRES